MDGAGHQGCSVCKHNHTFEIDPFLLEEIKSGNCVIFAGSGISTENAISAPHSLYTELAVAIRDRNCTLPFPDLAERFCERGDGRFKLLKIIQDRFDYISKFRELKLRATRFHSELATMPYFDTIITTNWDKYFEECCAAKPFVYDLDMRFWHLPRRRVLKIHGTIDDYSSVVATRTDYTECLAKLKESLVGAKLKECLSSKTCIFVGYSLKDDDFRDIFAFVHAALGKFSKRHYIVTPFLQASELPTGVVPIVTDGTFFLRVIKSHMCQESCYFPDDIYDELLEELVLLQSDHDHLWEQYGKRRLPQMIASAFYQDGLQHGYEIMLDGRTSGRFSCIHEVDAVCRGYENKIKEYRKQRKYDDVAYFRGYQNAFLGLALSKTEGAFTPAPRYYFEGYGEMTRSAFSRHLRKFPGLHRAAYKRFQKISKSISEGLVLHHPPWG